MCHLRLGVGLHPTFPWHGSKPSIQSRAEACCSLLQGICSPKQGMVRAGPCKVWQTVRFDLFTPSSATRGVVLAQLLLRDPSIAASLRPPPTARLVCGDAGRRGSEWVQDEKGDQPPNLQVTL